MHDVDLKVVVLRILEEIQVDLSKIKASIKSKIPGCASSSGSLTYVKSLVLHISNDILQSHMSLTLSHTLSPRGSDGEIGGRMERESLLVIQRLLDVVSAWSTSFSFQQALSSTLTQGHSDKITLLDVANPDTCSLLRQLSLLICTLARQLTGTRTSTNQSFDSQASGALATLLEICHTWMHFHISYESVMKSGSTMHPYINTIFILYFGILEVWESLFPGSISGNVTISDVNAFSLRPCFRLHDGSEDEALGALFTNLVEVTATFAENHKVSFSFT